MKSVLALLVMSLALNSENAMMPITGNCRISAADKTGYVEFDINHAACEHDKHCYESRNTRPVSEFSGFSLENLMQDGTRLNAEMIAEAGVIRCSGQVRDSSLEGEFSFVPDPSFVAHMRQLGFTGLTSQKLEVYALFHVETSWLKSLQTAGVRGITPDNIVALRIFHVDADYVQSLAALGYPYNTADDLVAMKIHGVSPSEVKAIQGLGYRPTAKELVEMRIFKVNPEFIQRMQSRGLKDLTISKLVQIRIFKLDE